jgi:hypothetical protein
MIKKELLLHNSLGIRFPVANEKKEKNFFLLLRFLAV